MLSWLVGATTTEVKVSERTQSKTTAALRQNQSTYERLGKRQREIQKRIDAETAKANTFIRNSNKSAALQCLRNRKQLQVQYDALSGQMSNLFHTTMSLENAMSNIEVINANQQTSQTMKDIFTEIGGIDKVEGLLDDMREITDRVSDISTVLSEPTFSLIDDDDVENEMSAMEEDILANRLHGINIAKAEISGITRSKQKEELEFDELEKELMTLR